jgi:hypothetical protein
MAKIPNMYLRHKVTIQLYSGSSGTGIVYGETIVKRAHVVSGRPTSINVGAEEITADTQVFVNFPPDIPARSLVTWNGLKYTVIGVDKHSAPGLPTPDHQVLKCVPLASG